METKTEQPSNMVTSQLDATWAAVLAEAIRRGACVDCLRASDWQSFNSEHEVLRERVKFVKHLGACPRRRRQGGRR